MPYSGHRASHRKIKITMVLVSATLKRQYLLILIRKFGVTLTNPRFRTIRPPIRAFTLAHYRAVNHPNSNLPLSELWIPPLIYVGEKMGKASEDWCDPTAYASQAYGKSPRTIPIPAIKKGRQGLVIARISAGVTMTLRGIRRSFGIVLKLYPTVDENHENLLQTANVFLADDLGGTTASHITEVDLTNAPHVTGLNRGNEIPILLKEGLVFELVDRMATIRQVYPIAELGKASDEKTNAPEFMRLKASSGHPV